MDIYEINKHILNIIWHVGCVNFWFGAYGLKTYGSLGYSTNIHNKNCMEPNSNCGVLKKNRI